MMRQKKTYAIGCQGAIFLILIGMFLGYILGLWQQIAQKRHRENCPAAGTKWCMKDDERR